MMNRQENDAGLAALRKYTLIILLCWTLLLAGSLYWNVVDIRYHIVELALHKARTHFDKDLAFRVWATKHGGVYVPVSERTPPNPYLSHVPERDIVAPSGKRLTLMNPAYMMRQLNEEYPGGDVSGHITSLKTLRPGNRPDEWEREALLKLAMGEKEVFEFVRVSGIPHLRLMRPMVAREKCLKCHGHQGYKAGDVRGGVSVSVSMLPYTAIRRDQTGTLIMTHVLIWLMGVMVIGWIVQRTRRHILERQESEGQIKKHAAMLEAAIKELESFSYAVSHDLRAPLRAIDAFSHLLLEDDSSTLSTEGEEMVSHIVRNARNMGQLIDGLLFFTKLGQRPLHFYNVDMRELAELAFQEVAAKAKGRKFDFSLGALPNVRGDKKLLLDVFLNLLDNAVKFTRNEKSPSIEVGWMEEKEEYVYFVKDNGVGFDMKYKDKLFGIFQHLHAPGEFEGVGLGLAFVQRIVQRHGGRVWAEGEVGKGAVFYFSLPQIYIGREEKIDGVSEKV